LGQPDCRLGTERRRIGNEATPRVLGELHSWAMASDHYPQPTSACRYRGLEEAGRRRPPTSRPLSKQGRKPQRARISARRHEARSGLRPRVEAQIAPRRQDGRPPRQQGTSISRINHADRGHANPERHPVDICAETPLWRPDRNEMPPRSANPSRAGLATA